MFRWTGWRKSEPSDLRSRPEHAPCQQPDRRWPIYKLSPPPKVQTERNLPKLAFEPDETGSPVDLGYRIPAKCAFFRQRGREPRKLKTRWRREWDSNPRATFAAAGFQDRAPAYRPVLASACVRRGRFQSPRSTSPAIPGNGARCPQARTDDAWGGANCRSRSASRPSHKAIS